jgi:hypothetical protein
MKFTTKHTDGNITTNLRIDSVPVINGVYNKNTRSYDNCLYLGSGMLNIPSRSYSYKKCMRLSIFEIKRKKELSCG